MIRNSTLLADFNEINWPQFERQGYTSLGTITPATLTSLQQAIDAVMLGTADVDYARLLMQLDSADGSYAGLGKQTRGFKGATKTYRKIQDLELEPALFSYLNGPLFRQLCMHVYGDIPIRCFRAMFMNKPAHAGTQLPWHQDRWTYLDRDPQITVWTALDEATPHNGCIEVLPGSHQLGVINPDHNSAFLNNQQVAEIDETLAVPLTAKPGQVWLLHNWLVHRSRTNNTAQPRRAFSVCYMDGGTKDANGVSYTNLVG